MKGFLKENQKIITFVIIWLFIQIIIYVNASTYRAGIHREYINDLYPFTEKDLKQTYDILEFLIYGILPCLILILLKFNSKDK